MVRETVISFEELPPDADEMRRRMEHVLEWAPWLVAVVEDEVVGYAYAARHRERAAYRWSVDLSAYVAAVWRGRGVGRALYDRLMELLREQRFVNAYGGVTEPNPASIALHRAIGMEVIGTFERVGWKFGAWHGVTWLGMRLCRAGRRARGARRVARVPGKRAIRQPASRRYGPSLPEHNWENSFAGYVVMRRAGTTSWARFWCRVNAPTGRPIPPGIKQRMEARPTGE